ncbi:MAG: hypothetical protein PCFJNLEI_01902 [Verrucomicrobiae bacterium]|nr:hypothetical protein [Verrucomicrobiae bacterium]
MKPGRIQCVNTLSLVCGSMIVLTAHLCFAETTAASWLTQIRSAVPEHTGLADAIRPILRDASDSSRPDLAVITFRANQTGIQEPVVQLFHVPAANRARVLNSDGVVRTRVGESMTDAGDNFLRLILQPPECFGNPSEIRRQQRAWNLCFNGDLTLLREQTVEPLHVVGILTHPDQCLPLSLRGRVRAVVLSAQLDYGEWRGRLNFVTDNPDDAEQVASIVAAWRDFADSLAAHYAGDESGSRLRQALRASTVVVVRNQVTTTANVPASVMVRVAKEVAGHGGGCPPGGECDHDKIAVCHTTGNNSRITICLPPAAVAAHLAHGDTCGPCADNTAATEPNQ